MGHAFATARYTVCGKPSDWPSSDRRQMPAAAVNGLSTAHKGPIYELGNYSVWELHLH